MASVNPGTQTHDALLCSTSTTQLAPFLQRFLSDSKHGRVVEIIAVVVVIVSVDIGLIAVSEVATDSVVVVTVAVSVVVVFAVVFAVDFHFLQLLLFFL